MLIITLLFKSCPRFSATSFSAVAECETEKGKLFTLFQIQRMKIWNNRPQKVDRTSKEERILKHI